MALSSLVLRGEGQVPAANAIRTFRPVRPPSDPEARAHLPRRRREPLRATASTPGPSQPLATGTALLQKVLGAAG
jgi:hypothetical protein